MVDYKKFLGAKETRVLPHFGGAFLRLLDRRVRLPAPVDAGWWRFEISGRNAIALARAEADLDVLEALPAVRGHLVGEELVREGSVAEQLYFLPADQPMRFALIRARRWTSGQLIFETLELESDGEEIARRALEEERSLSGERGIPATLRAAFGYAVALEVGRRLRVVVSFPEVAGDVARFADGADGRTMAEAKLRYLAAEREVHARGAREQRLIHAAREAAEDAGRRRRGDPDDDAEARAEDAITKAGGDLLDTRRLEGALLEVTYRYEGQRFLTIVHRHSLQVVDAGICLAGYDDRVTLESLPSVIKEAIAGHRLVITRRDAADPHGMYHWERDNFDDEEV